MKIIKFIIPSLLLFMPIGVFAGGVKIIRNRPPAKPPPPPAVVIGVKVLFRKSPTDVISVRVGGIRLEPNVNHVPPGINEISI